MTQAAPHHAQGFLRKYLFSTDHKMIGRQYMWIGLFWLIAGGLGAYLIRWNLAWPETAVPGMGWVPEPVMYGGIIPPETYNMLVTMHGTIMVFFMAMPLLLGAFGNFLIPLMVGATTWPFPG